MHTIKEKKDNLFCKTFYKFNCYTNTLCLKRKKGLKKKAKCNQCMKMHEQKYQAHLKRQITHKRLLLHNIVQRHIVKRRTWK